MLFSFLAVITAKVFKANVPLMGAYISKGEMS